MPFPAGSFLGGFRTPATVQAASLHPPASETLNKSGSGGNLFDHFVGTGHERGWNLDAKFLRSLEVDK
jgi:hypothetical protein